MKYVVNWIPLRVRVRSRNTQPHLNVAYSLINTLEGGPEPLENEINKILGNVRIDFRTIFPIWYKISVRFGICIS